MDYKNARLVASSQVMVVVVPHVILITALSTKPFFLLFLGLLRPLTFESYFGLRLWTRSPQKASRPNHAHIVMIKNWSRLSANSR